MKKKWLWGGVVVLALVYIFKPGWLSFKNGGGPLGGPTGGPQPGTAAGTGGEF